MEGIASYFSDVLTKAFQTSPDRSTLVLFLALVLDMLFGEPPRKLHPVVMTGKVIQIFEKYGKRVGGERLKFLYGFFLMLVGCSVFLGVYVLIYVLIEKIIGSFRIEVVRIDVIEILYEAFFLKTTFALRDLVEHSGRVLKELKDNRLEQARKELSRIVSRDTKNLQKSHVISATVESVAENTVDSFFAPVFFFFFFGVGGSIIYRVINTLDAMIGYKTDEYRSLGFIPAKTDDIVNFIPARVCVPFVVFGAFILGLDAKRALRTLWRFRGSTPSPNSYVPIALFSGALNVKLEKIGFYSIGNFDLPESEEIIERANLLAVLSCMLFAISTIALMSI